MARKGKQATRNGGLPAWLLVLIGILIGGIGMWSIMHTNHMPISRPDNPPAPQTSQSTGGAGIATNPEPTKSKYDFYSVLPEKDVIIPDAELSAQAKAEQQQTSASAPAGGESTNGTATATASTAGSGDYLLQVGSFPNAGDAEALKAKLALKGFRADIQPITINGKTWNRVRIGPFKSASALETAKQKLEAAGVQHVMPMKKQ